MSSILSLTLRLLLLSLSFFFEFLLLAPARTDPSALHSTTTPSSGIATTGVDFEVSASSTIVGEGFLTDLSAAKSMDLRKLDGMVFGDPAPSPCVDLREKGGFLLGRAPLGPDPNSQFNALTFPTYSFISLAFSSETLSLGT